MKKLTLSLLIPAMLVAAACERSVGHDPDTGTLTYKVSNREIPLNANEPLAMVTELDFTTSDQEGARITSLTFKLKGEISPERIHEVWLYHELPFEFYADTVAWNENYVTFDLSSNPIMIPPNTTEIFTVRILADFDSCVDTIAFDIAYDSHITAIGEDSNQPMDIEEDPQSTSGPPVSVVGENVMFTLSPYSPPARNVFTGADDHEYIRFLIKPQVDVEVQETVIHINLSSEESANHYSDVKFMMKNQMGTWETIAGPLDLMPGMCPDGFCSIGIMDLYYLDACEEYEIKVTMDVSSGAHLGSTASVTIPSSHFNFYDIDNDRLIPEENVIGGDLQGTTQEVVF